MTDAGVKKAGSAPPRGAKNARNVSGPEVETAPARPESYDKKVGLVLQGGGALGSYQAGVYEALSTSEYLPDRVAGISIGAINAAIIAGNAPGKRVERLRDFWERITTPPSAWPILAGMLPGDHRRASSLNALLFGQPGFFEPRPAMHWLFGITPTSHYDTSALKGTLEQMVDFDRINAGEIRFSVGAVNVRTGNFAYFDNAHTTIRPEHVMASSALPPGFPAVKIDGEHYWDGGLVSNTPLEYVLESIPRRSRLTFQVDLFHARGHVPTDLEEVTERDKDIRYSSKTRASTNTFRTMHDVRHNINALWDQLPEILRNTPEAKFLYNFGYVTTMDIVELIYRPDDPQGYSKDYEFSRTTMQARWARGCLTRGRHCFSRPGWSQCRPRLVRGPSTCLRITPPRVTRDLLMHGNFARTLSAKRRHRTDNHVDRPEPQDRHLLRQSRGIEIDPAGAGS